MRKNEVDCIKQVLFYNWVYLIIECGSYTNASSETTDYYLAFTITIYLSSALCRYIK